MLVAASPVAEYEVRLCIDGPKVEELYGSSAEVDAWAKVTAGETRGLRIIGSTDAEGDFYPSERRWLDREVIELNFKIDGAGPWQSSGGRRCGEPQIVRFELEGADEETRVDVDWDVGIFIELGGRTSPNDDDLVIEIEALGRD
ncbi:MAG: hypothetical protein AB1Z98_36255 [Nannocystaceae bacterium]